ncbi:uncharacterized protein BXZ73DRAFT_74284 [Epithele typhae]|uniref:uncharacterized protein n=1 Tax=Epithele typhae TaxID=378194 RepID=UPI0020081401|nr:uncharacterized protein BXZ73DRAFT_74284 [Epithele typhae]KAH9943293.1 hypothetical protein BXZ73DRAFT_74284 [Epithele typhae]
MSDAASSSHSPRVSLMHQSSQGARNLVERRQIFDHRKHDAVQCSVQNRHNATVAPLPSGRPTPTPKSSGDWVPRPQPLRLCRRSEDSASSANTFSRKLKELCRMISGLDTKLLGSDKDRDRAEDGERGSRGVSIKGRASNNALASTAATNEGESERWRKLVPEHQQLMLLVRLVECIREMLALTLAPTVPASLKNIPQKYNLIIRLWSHVFYHLLESLRQPTSSPVALEYLEQFLNYTYVFHGGPIEEHNFAQYRRPFLEALGDLSRYWMAVRRHSFDRQHAHAAVLPTPARIDDSPQSSEAEMPLGADDVGAVLHLLNIPSVGQEAACWMELNPDKERWRRISHHSLMKREFGDAVLITLTVKLRTLPAPPRHRHCDLSTKPDLVAPRLARPSGSILRSMKGQCIERKSRRGMSRRDSKPGWRALATCYPTPSALYTDHNMTAHIAEHIKRLEDETLQLSTILIGVRMKVGRIESILPGQEHMKQWMKAWDKLETTYGAIDFPIEVDVITKSFQTCLNNLQHTVDDALNLDINALVKAVVESPHHALPTESTRDISYIGSLSSLIGAPFSSYISSVSSLIGVLFGSERQHDPVSSDVVLEEPEDPRARLRLALTAKQQTERLRDSMADVTEGTRKVCSTLEQHKELFNLVFVQPGSELVKDVRDHIAVLKAERRCAAQAEQDPHHTTQKAVNYWEELAVLYGGYGFAHKARFYPAIQETAATHMTNK